MFPRRIRSFAALHASEQLLTLRAHGWLLVARVALSVMPFARVRGWVRGPARGHPIAGPDWPAIVRRAMDRLARTFPTSSCLARALVAERLLRSGGHPASLTIGVARRDRAASARDSRGAGGASGAPGALRAHAWVESGETTVVGGEEREEFLPLFTAGEER